MIIDGKDMINPMLSLAKKYDVYAHEILEVAHNLVNDSEEILCAKHMGRTEAVMLNSVRQVAETLVRQQEIISNFAANLVKINEALSNRQSVDKNMVRIARKRDDE